MNGHTFDNGYTLNYVGNGEFDVTQTMTHTYDATAVSWVGESRTYWDETEPGYLNPNSGAMDVRGRGYATVKVSAKKGVRTVSVTAQRYANSEQRKVRWSRARVQIQELKGSKWVTIKSAVASSAGTVSTKVKTGKHAFRAVVAASDLAWSAISTSVKK